MILITYNREYCKSREGREESLPGVRERDKEELQKTPQSK